MKETIEELLDEFSEALIDLQDPTNDKDDYLSILKYVHLKRQKILKRFEELKALLREHQWAAQDNGVIGDVCPECRCFEWEGHTDKCKIGLALREAPGV